MFSNCPYCGFLVALDEAGQPLSRCPNCAQRLRDDDGQTDVVATTPTANGAGTTTSDTDGHAEPGRPPSTPAPKPSPEPSRGEAGAEAAGTNRQPRASVELQPTAVAGETAPARPEAAVPAVASDTAALARPHATPEPNPPQTNADGDADTMQAAVTAAPVSKVRAPEDEAAAMPVGASAAATDDTSLRSIPQAPPPDTAAVAADAAPVAADVQRAKAAEADETDATPYLPATTASAEPVPGGGPEPAVSLAPSKADDAADSTMATESSATATEQTTTPLPSDVPPPAEPGAADRPAPPGSDVPAAAGQGDGTATPAATPTAALPQTADAPVEIAPIALPKPVRRKPGTAAVPSFARARAGAVAVDRRRLALRWTAIAALSLLLILQLVLSDRARLAGDARWRGVLTQLCGVLQCTLPAWHEPRAFRVVERDITLRRPGVLRVSARIRNDAHWAQPWPALQLTLSDANGRDVATRVFTPREYLGGTPTQSELGSGQSAALSMEIVEPGPHAVAFTFDFH